MVKCILVLSSIWMSIIQTTECNWADKTLSALSLKEKIGQLFCIAVTIDGDNQEVPPYIVNFDYVQKIIKQYQVGGIVFLGNSSPQKQIDVTKKYNTYAKIPLLVCQDCESGLGMRMNKNDNERVLYPQSLALGAIQNSELIYALGYEVGMECRALGIHMNLAPVVDVNTHFSNPIISNRSFGSDPQRVAQCALAYAEGMHDAGILTCLKHFPGHGDTGLDSHAVLPVIHESLEELHARALYPFRHIIASISCALMMGHLVAPALDNTQMPASLSETIIRDFVRGQLAFDGLVVTDGLGMGALKKWATEPGELEYKAFLAGNDILLCPVHVSEAVEKISNAIQNDYCSEAELDRRVMRILRAKEKIFALQRDAIKNPCAFIIRDEAYDIQKKIYAALITCAFNKIPAFVFDHTVLSQSTVVQIGHMPGDIVLQKCKQYVAKIYKYKYTIISRELINNFLKNIDIYPMVTFVIGSMHKKQEERYGISEDLPFIVAELKKRHKWVQIMLCGTPYGISYIGKPDAVLIGYEDSPIAQCSLAAVLLGQVNAYGVLPITIPSLYS